MLKVGLTGGIGSGKSTVALIFRLLGVPVFIADIRAHALMSSDENVKENIRSLLGEKAYDSEGRPDRKFIASKVFADHHLLTSLNTIIHPSVRRAFAEWSDGFTSETYVLQEAAVLFESGGAQLMDENIVVWAPEDLRVLRVSARDQITEEEVGARLQYQWSDEEKVAKAQFIVINDNTHSLIRQVLDIHHALQHLEAVRH